MDIHELRDEALCYYDDAPRRIQDLVHEFFISMDTNRDGGVDFYEIHDFLEGGTVLTRFVDGEVFNDLDEDGDGSLNFDEFITFFFMIFMMFDCYECGDPLVGQRHYTCAVCFTSRNADLSTTYNVCGSCYNRGYFHHRHRPDNLVNYRAMILQGAGRSRQPATQDRYRDPRERSRHHNPRERGGHRDPRERGRNREVPTRTVSRRRETFSEIIGFLDGAHTVYEVAGAAAACTIM